MDVTALRDQLDEVFDHALIHHGFMPYMRDYEMILHCTADPITGIKPTNVRLLFKMCVVAEVVTTLPRGVWAVSLDDRLIKYESGKDLDGFVWGVRWQVLYPGASAVSESTRAAEWTQDLGIEFHEVRIEANGHTLNLVFSELESDEVPVGYAPFVVGED